MIWEHKKTRFGNLVWDVYAVTFVVLRRRRLMYSISFTIAFAADIRADAANRMISVIFSLFIFLPPFLCYTLECIIVMECDAGKHKTAPPIWRGGRCCYYAV